MKERFDLTDDGGITRGAVVRALARDAFLQVVDNKVFRILLVLVLGIVAATFAVGFREDEVVLFFGLSRVSYESFLGALGFLFPVLGGANRNELIVERFQTLFADQIAGLFGAFFAVVATAFFVPRMLEKGAADTLFSKPVGRAALVLSRYFASVLFVGLLAGILVGGMYLGFAVASGYSNPRFLWSAVMLVYLFAILSAFSTLFGALTRSSVATLLLTLVAWATCSGVHNVWIAVQWGAEQQERGELVEPDGPEGSSGGEAGALDAFLSFLGDALTAAHYVLPRTNDARDLTELLRQRVTLEGRTVVGGVRTRRMVVPIERRLDGAVLLSSPFTDDELVFERGDAERIEARIRPVVVYLETDQDGPVRAWSASTRAADRALEDLREETGLDDPEVSWPPPWAEPAELVDASEVDFGFEDPFTSYRRKFTWDQTDPGYSPWYSLGSTLVGCVLLVLAAVWRVRRIDF